MNEAVAIKNCFTINGGGRRLVCPFKRRELWKCIGCIIWAELFIGGKDTRFLLKDQKILVGCHLLKYEEMFVETPIYIRYVVLAIVIFTYTLAIELFYPKNFIHFLDVSLSTCLSL